MILFGWVLWHINHCRLFNAKSYLYIYIEYTCFGLVGFYGISNIDAKSYLCKYIKYTCIELVVFYGISTIVGHLMSNPLYICILNIYDLVLLGFMAYQPL